MKKQLDNKIYSNMFPNRFLHPDHPLFIKSKKSSSSILLHFISQIKPGVDLVSITCPTFIIAPFSFLEARSDIYSPSNDFTTMGKKNPISRFLTVLKWAFTSMSFVPSNDPQSMKPYNPILGEVFKCVFKHSDNSETYCFSEQVSHHPPITAVHYENPTHKFSFDCTISFSIKFHGNSVEAIFKNIPNEQNYPVLTFFKGTENEEQYILKLPNVLTKGIIFGTTKIGNSGNLIIECKKTGLEFRGKVETNSKHSVNGHIFKTTPTSQINQSTKKKEKIYHIQGGITSKFTFQACSPKALKNKENKKNCFLIMSKDKLAKNFTQKIVENINDQKDNESRKVWHNVSAQLHEKNFSQASREKHEIEENQRNLRKQRKEKNYTHVTELFNLINGEYIFKQEIIQNLLRKNNNTPSDEPKISIVSKKHENTKNQPLDNLVSTK